MRPEWPNSPGGPLPVNLPAGTIRASQSFRRSFSLAHISDLHLSRDFHREHFKSLRRLLHAVLREGCDHLVITGDIVSTGEIKDFSWARRILERYQFLTGNRLTVVPGNHDIFGGPHRAEDVLSFPQHIRNVDYRRRLDLFNEAFAESFQGSAFVLPGRRYPFVKRLGPFTMIGLNSVLPWSWWKNPVGSNGMVDEEQLQGLRLLVDSRLLENRIPIVVIHHHFDGCAEEEPSTGGLWNRIEPRTMRLRGQRRLLKLLHRLKVRVVLHGHVHRNDIYARKGIRFANGAGAVSGDSVPFLRFNRLLFADDMCTLDTRLLRVPFRTSAILSWRHRPAVELGPGTFAPPPGPLCQYP